MSNPLRELISYWKSQNLLLAPGNRIEALQDFELRHSVKFPNDFREYLLQTNGMLEVGGHDCDPMGFSFWPLHRIRSVTEECAAQKIEAPSNLNVENYFVFADYLQWSWAYAIHLGTSPAGTNRVIHVGTFRPKFVADSFTHFVTLYLHDAPELYSSSGSDSDRQPA